VNVQKLTNPFVYLCATGNNGDVGTIRLVKKTISKFYFRGVVPRPPFRRKCKAFEF